MHLAHRLHHAGLVVADLEASTRWYETTLGFRVERRLFLPDPGLDIVYLTGGPGVRIELLALRERPAAPPGTPDLLAAGTRHLCFEVDDLEAAAAALRARGARFTQEPKVIDAARVKNCWIADPEGHPIEFVEWMP